MIVVVMMLLLFHVALMLQYLHDLVMMEWLGSQFSVWMVLCLPKRIIVKQEKMQRTILSYLNACGMNKGMVVMLGLKAFLLVQ